jgi:hypothetical protein
MTTIVLILSEPAQAVMSLDDAWTPGERRAAIAAAARIEKAIAKSRR